MRKLRAEQTPSEALLWDQLRGRKLHGKKFLRQHPIPFYSGGRNRFFVADFYCAESRLIVELDGKIHENQKEHDEMRTVFLQEMRYRVIRFKNEELAKMAIVLNKIKESL